MSEDIVMRDKNIDNDVTLVAGPNAVNGYQSPRRLNREPTSPENQALGALGSRVKRLVNTINKLSLLGIESDTLPLPKIVVVGEQSAGKSSLIEAISEIKVPRASGVCTKCPLHINISENSEAAWLCNIILDKKYDYYHSSNSDSREDFGPWRLRSEPASEHFKTVHNIGELEHFLWQAQLATLNPREPPQARLANMRDDSTQVPFSPNIVRLDISGPGLTNLSFYDLPGVIAQSESRSENYVVRLVKSLVKSYIREENALVLLVCAMEGDIANSSAAKLVEKLEAKDRCIGVLTKPDRLQPGDHHDVWREILDDKKFCLGNGYYVAKQLNQSELDTKIGHVQARSLEYEFFKSTDPWNSTFKRFSPRFGTDKLHAKLSELLVQQIRKSLPEIKSQIHQKLSKVKVELSSIPKPVKHDSLRIVYDLMTKFKYSVDQVMKGGHPHNQFKQEWEDAVEQFQQALKQMKPLLHTKLQESKETWSDRGATTSMSHFVRHDAIEIPSDEEADVGTPSTGRRRRREEEPHTPRKATRRNGSSNTDNSPSQDLYNNSQWIAERRAYLLEDINRVLRQTTSSQIPGIADPKAVEILIAENTARWQVAIDRFFETTKAGVSGKILQIVDELLVQWRSTLLPKTMQDHIQEFLGHVFNELDLAIKSALLYETSKPMTYNKDWLSAQERSELYILQTARFNSRANEYLNEKEQATGRLTAGDERLKKLRTVTPEQLGPDGYAKEIEIMSKVRGYYNVAYARLVDHTCQATHVNVFKKCQTELGEYLMQNMGLYQDTALDTCSSLLAEDAEREKQRVELQKQKDRLEKAERELNGLE